MESTERSSHILLVILLSALIHIGILFLMYLSKHYQPSLFHQKIERSLQKEKAATLFLPPKKHPKKKIVTLTPGHKSIQKNNAPAVVQKAMDTSKNNIVSSKQIARPQEEVKEKTLKKETPEQKVEKKENTKSDHKQINMHTKKKADRKQSSQKKVPQKVPPKQKIQIKKPAEQIPVLGKKAQKESFSLKDLQKGFTTFLRHGNNSVLSRKGNTKGDPTARDLKLISYYKHLNEAFESAVSHIGRINTTGLSPDDSAVYYRLTIERDGSISDYKITHKSKHDKLNAHALKVIQNIGSLPPLPHYIEAPHFFRSGFLYFYDPLLYRR